MSNWTNIKDELPQRGHHVLLKIDGNKNPWAHFSANRVIGFLDKGPKRWFLHAPGNPRVWHVTHWTEIPAFSEAENGKRGQK